MKIPVLPPPSNELFSKAIKEIESDVLISLIQNATPVDQKGRYVHWDKLRHLPPPDGLSSELWWFLIKTARRNMYKSLPLKSKLNTQFQLTVPDQVLRELHWLDRYAAGHIQSSDAITNTQTRNTYLIRSLIEEAINSSQLEGASTTRDVAKEMIRQNRTPKDKSEQMILNNYHAMQFISEIKDEVLTPSIVFELHQLLTTDTLEQGSAGSFRTQSDKIHVVDNLDFGQRYL